MSTRKTDVTHVELQGQGEQDALTTSANAAKKKNYTGIIISLIALYTLWSGTYLGMRLALQTFPPFLLAGIRFSIAGSLMFAFMRARGAPMPTRKEWLGSAVVGSLLLLCGNGGVVFAEQWVSSGITAVALGAVPLWAALFGGLFGRWPTRIEWCGLLIGFAGLVWLNLGGNFSGSVPGYIILLITPVCWAAGSVLSQHVSLPKGFMGTAAELLCGGALLLIAGSVTGERITLAPTPVTIGAMLFLIVGGALVAYTAYGYLLSHVRPALATSYAYVNPLVAVGLGVWIGNEQINLPEIFAMLIILGGVVLVTLGRE